MFRTTARIPNPILQDDPDPEAQFRRISEKIAILQAENAKLRRALAEKRRAVDILLAIDRLEDRGRRGH